MAAGAERPDGTERELRQWPRQGFPRGPSRARATVTGLVACLIRWAGLALAAIQVVHVLLTVGGANPGNVLTVFFAGAAEPLALAFRDLFTPADAALRVLVNHGLAALFWLVVSGVAARLVRRLG